jgi:Sec-independent protein translocase protein TatA
MIIAGMIGVQEIIVTLLILLLITGGSYLPRFMRNAGKQVRRMEENSMTPDDKINKAISDILKNQKEINL